MVLKIKNIYLNQIVLFHFVDMTMSITGSLDISMSSRTDTVHAFYTLSCFWSSEVHQPSLSTGQSHSGVTNAYPTAEPSLRMGVANMQNGEWKTNRQKSKRVCSI